MYLILLDLHREITRACVMFCGWTVKAYSTWNGAVFQPQDMAQALTISLCRSSNMLSHMFACTGCCIMPGWNKDLNVKEGIHCLQELLQQCMSQHSVPDSICGKCIFC